MKTKILPAILMIMLFFGCRQVTTHQENELTFHKGPIKITGAFALNPLVNTWITEFQKTHPAVQFDVKPNGSGNGLKDLSGGNNDIAMISSEVIPDKDSVFWVIPVARLGVVPIVSDKNPYLQKILKKGMTKDFLNAAFAGQKNPSTWGEIYGISARNPVKTYLRSDSSGATDVFGKFLWLSANEMKGIGVDGEAKMIEAVKNDPDALGYCNFIYAIDPKTQQFSAGIHIIPLDLNMNGLLDEKEDFYGNVSTLQRAMWSGRYPCVLNRNLYLVTKGKPATREVMQFLIWVLTEGQKMVAQEGYIELHSFEIPPRLYALRH
ncbi:MAG: substrate-binding domain-containing protein [Bacteroidetes bacterium]|nr:substrate-binding domain-containing protein [Bacteroidota bacterium]